MKWLDFKITNRCNNNCVYCGVSHDNVNSKELIPINIITETIKSAVSLGFTNFALLGGEPSIRENIEKLFTAFEGCKNVNVLIITNGLEFNEQLVHTAFSCGAGNVHMVQSFDSFVMPNYKHQNPDKILENISVMKKIAESYMNFEYKCGVHIHSVISRENYNDVYHLVNYFYEKDIDISLGLVCPSKFDNIEKPTEYNHFNFAELDIILRQLDMLEKEKKLDFANKVLYEYLQVYPFGKVNISKTCKAGKHHVIINADGEVFPCITQSYAKNTRYGNINNKGFDEIYKSMQNFICNDGFAPACWDHYLWNKMEG
jgi:molybdenum cofactor biosynthesis enzyme MoaA